MVRAAVHTRLNMTYIPRIVVLYAQEVGQQSVVECRAYVATPAAMNMASNNEPSMHLTEVEAQQTAAVTAVRPFDVYSA